MLQGYSEYPLTSLRSMSMLNRNNYINEAGVDSQNQSDMAMARQERKMREMGVNPSAGRYQGSMRSAAIDAAAAKAASMTKAGRWVDQENFGRQSQIAQMGMQQARDRNSWSMNMKQMQQEEQRRRDDLNKWLTGRQDAENEAIGAMNSYAMKNPINRNSVFSAKMGW